MNMMLGRNLPGFCKDTAYRFMKMDCINRIRFTTILSSRIVSQSIYGLTSDQRVNAFVIDDSMFERGRSGYLLSVLVDVEKDGMIVPAKVVYVRNRNKRNEYLCLISINIEIDENEIIRIYGKRWNIEVFFKVCKSCLRLAKECRSLSYDAMTAHVGIVFTRYMILSVENRESQDEQSLGELFLYFSNELADITWLEFLKLLMEIIRDVMKECLELSDETISELVDIFIKGIPSEIQAMLKVA